MLKLIRENFIKARDYVFAHSDDITREWFRYNFEDGDTDAFMEVLAKYQHENGGFGGLCYEFDYQGPCLKSTEFAILYIIGLKEKPNIDHPIIRGMMKYLLERYRSEIGNWGEVFEPEMNDGVHPRWCTYGRYVITPTADEDERIKHYDPNERVIFAAFVALYPELVPEELYLDIIKYPCEYILRYYDENSPDFDKNIVGSVYNLLYFKDFVPCLKDKFLADKLAAVLRQNPTACMELDFTRYDTDYVHLPCDFVDSPDSFLYPAIKDLTDGSLEYIMKRQSGDGAWHLRWSMGGEEFRRLQELWEAYSTLGMLVKLGRFGMIES